MIGAIHFTDTITLGSVVLGCAVAFGVLVAVVRGVRWRVAAEVSSAAADELRKALADEKEISAAREQRLNDDLARTREDARQRADDLRTAQQTIARLEQLPDLARVVSLLDSHEVRAQERHESVVQVLQALTDRLTTTNGGN